MKGIILAGGSGTRLYPLTKVISKQLLPVYDKPMIYYSLSTLMLSGIKEILIISTPTDISLYERLLKDGSHLGLKISYKVQPSPDGLAQAFILGEEFIGDDNVALVLGDNIFYGTGFTELLRKSVKTVTEEKKAVIFGYEVKDANRYGVVEFNKNKEVVSIEEKPVNPKSNYAVVGLYYYPNDVIEIAKNVKPSNRGELEITTVNNIYLNEKKLKVELMGRGFAWLDTGTIDAINNASNFIRTIEERQGLKVACLEEIAYQNNFINKYQLNDIIKNLSNDYANYLSRLIDN
ncbi:MAG: glucose-1-phosphate thymidylyltransferase RfbA [Candidatus Neomarinimicrobiota bacterium]|jgi:glucose-1-phosphate thymidylyltransferase|uniref:glucose-1-phosphate thymidylyltransferase n=1 Tax=marine metagenome TaxID=408172 RepID=A0A381RGH7_9ZZZZ|nr:glucose-1-phosphate thymidylyltransferase RfbA [Candidatus Neomarinimicrobiota bacterium]MED5554162.1 glucose-1-phosphate thymidylyltransferase RfbA [Candidatus Neomarinimicrobiota bacterium]|tara:strand:- start:13448 stop:14320 length:873 start_codon:yes stop_codon:yes gene_type:complete